ncbi:MAG: hypothetical protein BGN92_14825 [Sphingobacteriales bacterium 41-5]|nr:MAG: hypothetical protein BGN92_14825 [Sphingobacteriales bacterium 41-5]
MFYLGIDLGTSYFKAGVLDAGGKMKGFGRVAVPKFREGKISRLSHHDFLNTLKLCVDDAIKNAGISVAEIVSLSYGSQANSFVLLDKNRNELTPFILWNDEQADMMPEIKEFAEESMFKPVTGIGIGISNQFLINKLKWLQANDIDLWSRAHYVLTMPDYLCFQLTGERVVDASTASLTGMLHYKKTDWWDEAISAVGVDKSLLSRVLPIGFKASQVASAANFLNLNIGTAFCTGGLDHHVAAIGAGVGKLFDISESTGTVIAAVGHGNDCNVGQGVCVASGLSGNSCFKMAFNENGAVALEWYQKNYAQSYSIEELTKLAEGVPAGCDQLVAQPCANNFKELSGFRNRQRQHRHGHFVRAIMESTAKSLGGLFNELQIREPVRIVSTGGGAKSQLWRKIKNDITGYDLSTPLYPEAACLGAAMIAATGYGAFKNIYDVQGQWLQNGQVNDNK